MGRRAQGPRLQGDGREGKGRGSNRRLAFFTVLFGVCALCTISKCRKVLDMITFPGSSAGKESACNAGGRLSIPGSGRSPGEGQATHSSILGFPWWLSWQRIHPQCGRPGFDPWVGKIPWRRAWQPSPVFLPGESPWMEQPGGLLSVGSQRVGHD